MRASKVRSKEYEKIFRRLGEKSAIWSLSCFAVVFALIDTFIRPISLTALSLLMLAVLPWLIPFISSREWYLKSMKLPGVVEFEFSELKRISDQAADVGILASAENRYSFLEVHDRDPNLAMAGLRIELDRRILQLSKVAGITTVGHQNIGKLIQALDKKDVLDSSQVSVVADLVPILNKAVHASDLDNRTFAWAMGVGPQLLAWLDFKIKSIAESNK